VDSVESEVVVKLKTFKWEKVKQDAKNRLAQNLGSWRIQAHGFIVTIEQQQTGQPLKNWRENAKDLLFEAQKIVDNWDIRRAGKLLEIFPVLPGIYTGKPFTCEYDDKCNWVLVFKWQGNLKNFNPGL
jgi:hypothetical protein